ncbi:MAG: archease [Candidatus Omnitrophica bacterium]|nr:archease [Candidatus Omnitrophota bacterium]
MPYIYLDDIATADIAFRATAESLEELFIAAADATVNVMVEDLDVIAAKEIRAFSLENVSLEMLLFNYLQEFIFYKDAESLMLRATEVSVKKAGDHYSLKGEAKGESIDYSKYEIIVDVKAVTMCQFEVKETAQGWESTVVLDI